MLSAARLTTILLFNAAAGQLMLNGQRGACQGAKVGAVARASGPRGARKEPICGIRVQHAEGSAGRQRLAQHAGTRHHSTPDFVCSPDEQYAVLRAGAYKTLLRNDRKEAIVQLPDGRQVRLSRDAFSNRGTSSVRFSNSDFVLKLARQESDTSSTQDLCVLKHLQGTAVACPKLICASTRAILMENAGVPVSPANLPSDYHAQVSVMISSLHSLGFRHNDIWKKWIYGKKYEVEILVDSQGNLRLVDFNKATSLGPTCQVPMFKHRLFHPSDDRFAVDVLHAMLRVKESLEAYRVAGISGNHGICRSSAGPNVTSSRLGRAACGAEHHTSGAYAVLGNGNASTNQEWRSTDFMPRSAKPRHERSGLPGLANASVSLPLVADVRLCLEQCKMCPRCSAVSVSSHSKQCLWFDTSKVKCNMATANKGRVLDDFMSFTLGAVI